MGHHCLVDLQPQHKPFSSNIIRATQQPQFAKLAFVKDQQHLSTIVKAIRDPTQSPSPRPHNPFPLPPSQPFLSPWRPSRPARFPPRHAARRVLEIRRKRAHALHPRQRHIQRELEDAIDETGVGMEERALVMQIPDSVAAGETGLSDHVGKEGDGAE
ncbi:MAG: hypothetical protein Q9183_003613 [Haloplaca sp. 2 TL-2023]